MWCYFITTINHQSDMWQQIRFIWIPLSDLPFFHCKIEELFYASTDLYSGFIWILPFKIFELSAFFWVKKLPYFTSGKKVFQKELLREKKTWMNVVCHRIKHEIPPKLTFSIWIRSKQLGNSMEFSSAIWMFNSQLACMICYVESFQIICSIWLRCK